MEKCRNCDAPLKDGIRYCPECGADSKAKRFSTHDDVVAENQRLKDELAKKKDWIAPAPGGTDGDDI